MTPHDAFKIAELRQRIETLEDRPNLPLYDPDDAKFPTPDTAPDDSWYSQHGGIEPWEIAAINKLDPWEHGALKYLLRWRRKNGLEDLRKIKVYVDVLIEQELARQEGKTPAQWALGRLRKRLGLG